jgi:uncharacterized protein YyaL (SSP411 family)
MSRQTNRLIHAASPYLQQHAYNPVDWFEWGDEALARAKAEDKPILLSIGYSSCHWCHVMERESFEVDDIADIMNAYFVCIKVDREERPDIDQVYMEAVQALGVNGGWPLNVFLTPDQKPFYGGTYFSPPIWAQVLQQINKAFRENRDRLESTAEDLRNHINRSDVAQFLKGSTSAWREDGLEKSYKALASKFDLTEGGMDRAPKFVMPSVWLFLLRYFHLTGDKVCLDHITLTLNKVCRGGIYDQIGGGFARYSVDGKWLVPHFEKMLYDNAQMLSLYAEAFALTKSREYKSVIVQTTDWLVREMMDASGGFYSALDADSNGTEGEFYVWSAKELVDVLGPTSQDIARFYSVTDDGNWEDGKNILHRSHDESAFAAEQNIDPAGWSERLATAKVRLLEARERRVRPGRDDKMITAWNAMTIVGLTDCYRVLGESRYLDLALKNMHFLTTAMLDGSKLFRSYKGRRSPTEGFLDDYAYFIQAHIRLYQVTFDESWIEKAVVLSRYVIDHFYDPSDGYFHYSASGSERLIARKKEIFDNVIPSSNAVMAQNLHWLSILIDDEHWQSMGARMADELASLTMNEPNYMSYWAIVNAEISAGLDEVVLVGEGIHTVRNKLHQSYLPMQVVMGTTKSSHLPLIEGKPAIDGRDTIYVCYNRSCQLPVHTLEDAIAQLRHR